MQSKCRTLRELLSIWIHVIHLEHIICTRSTTNQYQVSDSSHTHTHKPCTHAILPLLFSLIIIIITADMTDGELHIPKSSDILILLLFVLRTASHTNAALTSVCTQRSSQMLRLAPFLHVFVTQCMCVCVLRCLLSLTHTHDTPPALSVSE